MRFFRKGFIEGFGAMPLKNKIISIFLPLIIIPFFILGIASNKLMYDIVMNNAIDGSKEKMVLVSKQFDSFVGGVESTLKGLAVNSNFQTQIKLLDDADEIVDAIGIANRINIIFSNYINIQAVPLDCKIILPSGKTYDTKQNLLYQEPELSDPNIIKAGVEAGGKVVWKNGYDKNGAIAIVSKSIIDIGTGEYLGVVLSELNESLVSGIYEGVKSGNTGFYEIVNRAGLIVSSPDKERLQKSIHGNKYKEIISKDDFFSGIVKMDGKNILAIKLDLSEMGWKLVGMVPIMELMGETAKNTIIIVILASICIIFLVFASIFVARTITKPLNRLLTAIKDISTGNLDTEVRIVSQDEIGNIAEYFNKMVRDLRILVARNYIEQNKKREMELALMQSQVNPHMLYNTLETIKKMATMQDGEGVYEIAQVLGAFYRDVLSMGRDIISLEDEINITKNYMKLQQLRKMRDFDYNIDIDGALYDLKIPKLILQPVVENSIIHGLEGVSHKGHINIYAYEKNSDVYIEIRDNGCGIKKDDLDAINLAYKNEGERVCFGLKSIHERLRHLFGEEYGIVNVESRADKESQIDMGAQVEVKSQIGMEAHVDKKSQINEGTRVTIKIPKAMRPGVNLGDKNHYSG